MANEIRRLDEDVVNRIAAGEVVQRPVNVVKELLENSLDAGATSVTVTLADGGLKLLQIQDNGSGIRRDDLAIVCERFTTSKLTRFEDLLRIGTFGFRGEALASVSHVARLTITTRTADCVCAYRASYEDGRLTGSVQPVAGNVGTTIHVADLFYNMSARRLTLRNSSEEFARVADMVGRYAVHNAHVDFSLKKHGSTTFHLRTSAGAATPDNIGLVFGGGCAKHLLECRLHEPKLQLSVRGYVSNVSYSAKRFVMVLFINERLVEAPPLKKALDQVYAAYLPRGGSPFVYLALTLPPETLDVNVHPTKNQVNFLHEQNIVDSLQRHVDSLLSSTASARSFYTQTLLPGVSAELGDKSGHTGDPKLAAQSIHPSRTVRTDHRDQKLDRFVSATRPETAAVVDTAVQEVQSECQQLSSVVALKVEMEKACHLGLRDILAEHSFVGVVNDSVSLIQHSTKLYLVQHVRLAGELFRQLALYQLGSCGRVLLEARPAVARLALLGLELPEAGWQPSDGPKQQIADYVTQLLVSKSSLLDDYFRIGVDCEGCLFSLPLLLPGHQPALSGLPLFLLRLATEVDWQQETACLASVAAELARFYRLTSSSSCEPASDVAVSEGPGSCDADEAGRSPPDTEGTDLDSSGSDLNRSVANDSDSTNTGRPSSPGSNKECPNGHLPITVNESRVTAEVRRTIEHVLMAGCKQQLLPPHSMAADGTFLQVADLTQLYRIFERC